jgi:hypothetical protein
VSKRECARVRERGMPLFERGCARARVREGEGVCVREKMHRRLGLGLVIPDGSQRVTESRTHSMAVL